MWRSLVLMAISAALVASLAFAGCGSGDTKTVTEPAAEAATETTSPTKDASERRIAKIEQETVEAELEAAKAQKEAAQAKKAAAKKARRQAARNAATEVQVEEEETSSEPPNVIGMRLPAAEAELSAAGFKTLAENTDTTFGILVPSHYTVCTETPLGGDTVEVLAQKYGC